MYGQQEAAHPEVERRVPVEPRAYRAELVADRHAALRCRNRDRLRLRDALRESGNRLRTCGSERTSNDEHRREQPVPEQHLK